MTGLADMDPGERALMQVVTRYQDTIKELRVENQRLTKRVWALEDYIDTLHGRPRRERSGNTTSEGGVK